MKSVLSSQFWNEEVSSARSLDAVAHALASEPPPLGFVSGTGLSRSQQLLLLQRLLGVPCTPSYVVDAGNKGGLVLDRVLGSAGGENWWATLTGRVRAQWLFEEWNQPQNEKPSAIGETSSAAANSLGKLKESASRLLESSAYALCCRSRLQLGPRTTLSSTSELDCSSRQSPADQRAVGRLGRIPWRGRVSLRHKLDRHQILVEAAHHECFIDGSSRYWDVPQSLAADVATRGASGGLRYRLGVFHSAGAPTQCCGGTEENGRRIIPQGALPGLRIQAAASVEKSVDLWKGNVSRSVKKSYSFLEARPHVSLSGVLGALFGARLDPLYGSGSTQGVTGYSNSLLEAAGGGPRHSADLLASVGLNAQFGSFERQFGDFTRLGIRLDVGAVSALKSAISSRFRDSSSHEELGGGSSDRGHPTLALSLQQQVLGPLRARIDSRVSFDPLNLQQQPHVREIVCGLDYPLDVSGAAKLCVWYSPTRREAMAEFRVLER